jgi:predicted P-loop ATPase
VELSYNEFSDVLLIGGQPLQDRQLSDLWFRIDSEFHFRPTAEFFEKSIKHLAWKNGFHPVKIYLDGLVWDGIPRVNTWLRDYAGAEDSEYLQAVSSIFLMAAVRRIDEPGCKYDEMLVLESGQGVEKSTTLATLCPDKAWFCDDLPLNVSSQRLIEGTLGKWIVEAADMAGKRKAEIEQLKAMLSRQVDGPARMAYARLPVERARQFVLVGTTNSQTYLTDPTGNRRFWPVEVSDLNIKGLRTVRDQLWAEAAHRSRGGESIRLPKSLWAEAGRRQDARRERDAWEEPIMRLLAAAGATSTGRVRVITSDIWDFLQIEIPRRDRYGSIRISEIMQRLGYKSKRLWHEGKTVVGYEGPQVSLDFEK